MRNTHGCYAFLMSFTIKIVERTDLPDVLSLMRDFARYENLEAHLEVSEARLEAAMFVGDAFVKGLIAFANDEPVGYAIFYPNFLTFRGQRGYFLEDLYVSEKARGTGLGKALISEVARLARERGFERLDFLVLDWNVTAIEFYKRLGAVVSDDESHFKITDEAFRGLCE